MVLRILNKSLSLNSNGVSIVEIGIVVFILSLIILSSILIINPAEQRQRAKDEKRLSDISTLDRAINEFNIDNESYPDQSDVLRVSYLLPLGNEGPLENSSTGWIQQDLSTYLQKLPTDPVNDSQFFYSYQRDSNGYEINARLEYYLDMAQNDGGNDLNVYEVGNDLTTI